MAILIYTVLPYSPIQYIAISFSLECKLITPSSLSNLLKNKEEVENYIPQGRTSWWRMRLLGNKKTEPRKEQLFIHILYSTRELL